MAEDIIEGLRTSWQLLGADEDTMNMACSIITNFFEAGATQSGLCDTIQRASDLVGSTLQSKILSSPDSPSNDDDDDYDNHWKNRQRLKREEEKAFVAKYDKATLGVRQPWGMVPVWVTPKINNLGFPENAFAAALPENDKNEDWINADGMARLVEMLETGAYSVTHPENCALLAVAALRHWGYVDEADNLLNTVKPWMNVLKLHPDNAPPRQPISPSMDHVVQRMKEEDVLYTLKWTQTSTGDKKNVLAVNNLCPNLISYLCELTIFPQAKHVTAIEKKRPLYYDIIGFWAETVVGGWPCQAWSENWMLTATNLIERAKDVNMKM